MAPDIKGGVLGAKDAAVRGQFHFVGLFGGGPDHTTALGGWGAELPGSAMRPGPPTIDKMEG